MVHITISQFFFQHLKTRCSQPDVLKADLTGKTVVVTGSNSGIGFEATKHFATMGPGKIIMACRNKERGEQAMKKIKEETGFANIELWVLDLNSFASVKAFADRFNAEGARLDLLIENAGLWPSIEYDKTSDGWTTILQSNTIAPAYHTLLLLPAMIRTANEFSTVPRIVVTGSFTHYFVEMDKDVVNSPNPMERFNSQVYYSKRDIKDKYYDSKLLELFFFRELQARLPRSGPSIVVNVIDPGYCASSFRSDQSGFSQKINDAIEKRLALTTEEGSRQIIYGAIAGKGVEEEEERLKGAYIASSRIQEVSDFVLSELGMKAQEKVWRGIVGALGAHDSTVTSIVDEWQAL